MSEAPLDLLEELRIQCSWLTGADYSNAMTLLDRIETALHQPVEPLRQALAELVALKDLKDRINGNDHDDDTGRGFEQLSRMQHEYARRKPLAWEAARAALHQSETPTSSMTSEPAQAEAVQRPVDGERES